MIPDLGGAEGGRAYCARELLRGETLEQRCLAEHRLDWREAVSLAILACRGLEAAHAVGVVHCDLKPANLFLTETGPGLKILDFGIATTSNDLGESPHANGQFAIVGTPEYMAPEQAQRAAVDGR